jgi:hypothetical protein
MDEDLTGGGERKRLAGGILRGHIWGRDNGMGNLHQYCAGARFCAAQLFQLE